MAADLPLCLLLLLVVIPLILFFTAKRSSPPRDPRAARLPPGPWALLSSATSTTSPAGSRTASCVTWPRATARSCSSVSVRSPRRHLLPGRRARSHAHARRRLRVAPHRAHVAPLVPGRRRPHLGAAWRHLRRVCTQELLNARRVRSFRPVREDELRRLLCSIVVVAQTPAVAPAPVNLIEKVSAYVADSTVRAIIGSRQLRDRDAYLRMLKDLFGIMPGMSLPDLFPSSRLAVLLSRAPARILAYRRSMRRVMDGEEEEDLVDVLLRLQKEVDPQFPLTTQNIKTVMLDIFGAGSETSSTTLNWVMAELLQNPRVMQKTQHEVQQALAGDDKVTEDSLNNLHYLRLVIKETLHLHPPAALLVPRQCRSPCQVLGFDVPAGTTVIVNAWAIGRDPAHWDDPDEFVPERFERSGRDFKGTDFEFIPFGAGRWICPGWRISSSLLLRCCSTSIGFCWTGWRLRSWTWQRCLGLRRGGVVIFWWSQSLVSLCPHRNLQGESCSKTN